ncbi:MAG: helix-turn-helix transcriptional regulator [Spongiibacteraceae bacterium]|nr:helix-turn-helix transcriptional regulator [Spongiibacteraceae bacterium]
MSELLFSFNKYNYQDCQDSYRGDDNQEYYSGDYSIDGGGVIDVRADRKSVGACSIVKLRSKTSLRFNRSLNHIREDAIDVVVLWFVKRGSLRISHASGHLVASAGEFGIIKSTSPFATDSLTDADSQLEILHVIVPSHVFRKYVPQEIKTGFVTSSKGRMFSIVENILTNVLEDSREFDAQSEQDLLDSALSLLAASLRGIDSLIKQRQSITEQRLETALRFIEVHLTDSKLSAVMVADACGISTRYLSFLLKQKDLSFSEYIWDQRMKIAQRWLESSDPSEISITEIAYRVGFKSPAHFSRMFKRTYHKGPREYRADCISELAEIIPDSTKELMINGSATTLQ